MFSFFCKINANCRAAIHIYLFHAGIQVEYTFYIHEQPP
jgi:hypothetical protein